MVDITINGKHYYIILSAITTQAIVDLSQ